MDIHSRAVRHLRVRSGRQIDVERGSTLYLANGSARVARPVKGGEILVALLRAPGMIGQLSPPVEIAYAIAPCEVLAIPGQIFAAQMNRDARLATNVARALADRVSALADLQVETAMAPVRGRVASLLCDYAAIEATRDSGGIRLKLSQNRLAADLGVSRRVIGSALRELRNEGLLSLSRREIFVSSLDALARAGSGRRSLIAAAVVLPQF